MKTARLLAFVLTGACLPWGASAGSNYIPGVPDTVMPPKQTFKWPAVGRNNFCTPVAGANVILYWNGMPAYAGVAGNPALGGGNLAYDLGWFMDTNDWAVADDGHFGTYDSDPNGSGFDGVHGIRNFARWDAAHNAFGAGGLNPPGPGPANKVGFDWTETLINANGYANAMTEIDAGRPLLTSWLHWCVFDTLKLVNINGNNYHVYDFGNNTGSISGWDQDLDGWSQDFTLGHTVTTVGYSQNYVLNGVNVNLLVVHDGVPSAVGGAGGFITPTDVAIVYRANQWTANVDVNPVPEPGSLSLIAGLAGLSALRLRRR